MVYHIDEVISNIIYIERKKIMESNKLKTKKFMKEIADAISKGTGIKNSFSRNDYGTLVYDFNIGCTYMTNNGGNSLYMAILDEYGNCYKEIISADVRQFINQAIYFLNKCNLG